MCSEITQFKSLRYLPWDELIPQHCCEDTYKFIFVYVYKPIGIVDNDIASNVIF